MTRKRPRCAAPAALLAVALALVGCGKKIEAPLDVGVCWHAVPLKDGGMRFNRLSDKVPNIETCAADLEGMRLRFLAIGGQAREIMGAYQGEFLFLQREGVFVGQTVDGARYLALVRTGDGRLAMPGAVAQP
jgi:hypothetical protein